MFEGTQPRALQNNSDRMKMKKKSSYHKIQNDRFANLYTNNKGSKSKLPNYSSKAGNSTLLNQSLDTSNDPWKTRMIVFDKKKSLNTLAYPLFPK